MARLQAYVLARDTPDPAIERLLAATSKHRAASPKAAGALLVELGAWDRHEDVDLWRSGVLDPLPQGACDVAAQPEMPLGALPRLDLPFVTIDNDAPHEVDDAVWAERVTGGVRLWVAIASPTCWLRPGHPADVEAGRRGATLYHPRHVVGMLPDVLARDLASLVPGKWLPALVFSATVAPDGSLRDGDVREAEVRVASAWRYSHLDAVLAGKADPGPVDVDLLQLLLQTCLSSEASRIAAGAWLLYKPEVDVTAPAHRPVEIRESSQTSPARRLVTEAMVLAGHVAGRFSRAHALAVPYRSQPRPQGALPPGLYSEPAEVYAVLKALLPARTSVEAEPHGVMGVDAYVQVTSPLRRYADIVAHRQIIAWLRGQPPAVAPDTLPVVLGRADQGGAERRQWQRRADRYFKLVWLAERGVGTHLQAQLVRPLANGQVLAYVPALALEVPVGAGRREVGDRVTLVVRSVTPAAAELTVAVVG